MGILSSIRQEAFCQGICAGKSEAQAYLDAGYKAKTEASAATCASRMLKNVEPVFFRIRELRAPALAANEVTTTRIIRRLAAIGFGDIRKVMKWDVNGLVVFNSADLTDEAAAMISEVKITPDGTITVKLHPSLPALIKLGEHLGMFSGESATPIPYGGNMTVNNDNRNLVFVDRPPRETLEQWNACRGRELAGEPALLERRPVVTAGRS